MTLFVYKFGFSYSDTRLLGFPNKVVIAATIKELSNLTEITWPLWASSILIYDFYKLRKQES